MQSKVNNVVEPVTIYRVPDDSHIQSVIEKKLKEISSSIKDDNRKASVFILGRYNQDEAYVPKKFNENLAVKFTTVHSSKGLEADHVIIPKLSSETLGFPSQIEDVVQSFSWRCLLGIGLNFQRSVDFFMLHLQGRVNQ